MSVHCDSEGEESISCAFKDVLRAQEYKKVSESMAHGHGQIGGSCGPQSKKHLGMPVPDAPWDWYICLHWGGPFSRSVWGGSPSWQSQTGRVWECHLVYSETAILKPLSA